MNTGQQILYILSALGAFNGIILGLYFLFNWKRWSVANILMGVLLLAISLRVTKTLFVSFNPGLPNIIRQLGLSACFLVGPALYYFTKAVQEKVTRVPDSWKWQWALLLGILVVGGALVPYQTYPEIWNNVVARGIYTQWALYLVATGLLLKRAGGNRFLNMLLAGNVFIFSAHLIPFARILPGMCVSGALSFTFVMYLTIFFNLNGTGFGNNPKPERKKIPENDARLWLEKLDKALLDKELYKDPNLKLNDLAQKINISAHQLSQLLNDNLGKSFSTYVNEYRINEACKLITTNDLLTLEAIGYEVGYNSKSTFYAAFRKIKDTTPALYKETIGNQAG